MAAEYSVETCRQLEAEFRAAGLHRPMRITRYDPGAELPYKVTSVERANQATVSLAVEKFVGGGFAGQVYQVRVKDIQAERRRHQPSAPRALPSRFEDDINREVRMATGAGSLRQVLEPLLGHIAASRPELPSAMDQLRELTAGPAFGDEVVEGEVMS